MKTRAEMKQIAFETLQGDIGILTVQTRLKRDTQLRKTITLEKLGLLYCMEIINTQEYFDYKDTINSF